MKAPAYTDQEDEVSLKELISKISVYFIYLRGKWLWLLGMTLLGFLAGYLYSTLITKKEYSAQIKFLVDGGLKQSAADPLAALGLKAPATSSASGDIFEALDVTYIMTSAPLLEKVLLSRIKYTDKDDYVINLFIKYRQKEKNFFGKAPYPDQQLYSGVRDSLDVTQNQFLRTIISDLSKNLKVERDLSTSLVIGTFKASDDNFPKYFLEKLIEKTSELYAYTKTARTVQNIKLLEHQADSIRREMSGNIESVAYSADTDPNSVRPSTVRVSYQKKQVDNAVLQNTYQTLASSLVTTRIELGKQLPFIQIYERPIFPLTATTGSSIKLNMLKFGAGAFILSIIIISLGYFLSVVRTYLKS